MSILEIMINVFEQGIIFLFIVNYISLNHKYNSNKLYLYIFVSSSLVTFSNVVLGFEGIFVLSFISVNLLFCWKYSNNSIVEKIFISIYPYVLISVINDLLTILSSYALFETIDYMHLTTSHYFIYVVILSKMILAICLFFTVKSRRIYDKYVNSREMMYLLSSILFIQIVFIFIGRIIYTDQINIVETVSIVLILSIVLVGVVYYFFDNLKRQHDSKINLLNKQMLNFEEKRYNDMQQMSFEISKLKHNLKHVLMNVKNSLDQNNYDEANSALNSYLIEVNKVNVLRNFNSSVLDFLLNKTINESDEKNYTFKYSVNLERSINLTDNDFMILLGNALENAVEHTKGRREIEVIIQQKNEYALLVINNSVDDSFLLNNLKKSEKGDMHGYGIKTMEEIVRKNNGFISFEEKGSRLYCLVLIPLK